MTWRLGAAVPSLSPHTRPIWPTLPREFSVGLYHDLAEKKTRKNIGLAIPIQLNLVSV